MAQTDEVLDQGITELVLLGTGGTATAFTKIVCMTDSTTCTAAKTHTFASPADAHCTDSGLSIATVDTTSQATTNTTGDTMTWDHVFTWTATKSVTGIQICNTDGDASLLESCFNGVLNGENTNTLTIDAQSTLDQA